jgi:septal ring factor EnvC (AmiA/AmiB activator)
MIIRTVFIALFLFALASTGFGQDRVSDSQTMREILTEIRGIHEDVRATESTQILLTELEMQQSVVNRTTETVDSTRSKLLDVQRDQKLEKSELERAEDHLSQASDTDEQKHIAQEIERHKTNIAALKTEESNRATTLEQMEQRLQNEQDSLENIEKELNAIVARLRPSSK